MPYRGTPVLWHVSRCRGLDISGSTDVLSTHKLVLRATILSGMTKVLPHYFLFRFPNTAKQERGFLLTSNPPVTGAVAIVFAFINVAHFLLILAFRYLPSDKSSHRNRGR